MEKSKTPTIWKKQMSDHGANWSEIWDSWVAVQHVWGTFGLLAFGAIAISHNLGLMVRDRR